MSLAANAICTLAESKTWLGISETTWDTILENLIGVVSTMIEDHLGHNVIVDSADRTEIFSGDGTSTYLTKQFPIASVTSLAIEDETAIDTADTDEFRKDDNSGRIWLVARVFSEAYPQNCTLKYKAGWAAASVPRPIWQATLDEVKRLYKLRDKNFDAPGVLSVSSAITGETITYLREQGLSEDARAKLAPYVLRRL